MFDFASSLLRGLPSKSLVAAAIIGIAVCGASCNAGAQVGPGAITRGTTGAITLRAEESSEVGVKPDSTVDSAVETKGTEAARRMQEIRANYRDFGEAHGSGSGLAKRLVLDFHEPLTLTELKTTGDFHITGGSCSEGRAVVAGDSCEVEVSFNPTGPGHRTGRLVVSSRGGQVTGAEGQVSVEPLSIPLGGTGYAPAVQFTPSQMGTVTGTLVSGSGLLSGVGQLAVDGGDNLYMVDTGNALIRFRDSSGAISTAVGGGQGGAGVLTGTQTKLTTPIGASPDTFGDVWFSDAGTNYVSDYEPDTYVYQILGGGSSYGCIYSAQCSPSSANLPGPTSVAVDTSGDVVTTYSSNGYGNPEYLIGELLNPNVTDEFFAYDSSLYSYFTTSDALTVDPFGYGYTYYAYTDPGTLGASEIPRCGIYGQNATASESGPYVAGAQFWNVAGSGPCGFSGDGGKASGAEIGNSIGQFAWDAAGNFYFTDTANNRVRRIDGLTGVIRTIAGNGSNGSGGDGGPSTSASLQAPLGLGVDSTGRVYTTAVAGTAPARSVRTFGVAGHVSYGTVTVGATTSAQTVLVSNVGNDSLNFTHVGFSGGNPGDFAIDPNTTTCNFTVPLQSGHNCSVGILFTPAAAGSRYSTLTMLDDTVSGSNQIQVAGSGATTATLTPTPLAFGSVAVGATSAAMVATLKNTGSGVLTINTNGIAITGANASVFSKSTTCGTTVAAGGSCTISVVFKPTALGAATATLTVGDNALVASQSVSLTGTGTGANAKAKGELSPTPVSFGSETVGSASTARSIALANTGGSALTISKYVLTGANASDFTETHTCGSTLAAGAKCTVSVLFKPGASGARSAELQVTTSAATLTSGLSGTGTPKTNPKTK